MRREQKLTELPQTGLKLTAEHFRKVVRRIETIVPTQDPAKGNLIRVKDGGNDGGMLISLNCKSVSIAKVPVLMCVSGTVTTVGIYIDGGDTENIKLFGASVFEVLVPEPEDSEGAT